MRTLLAFLCLLLPAGYSFAQTTDFVARFANLITAAETGSFGSLKGQVIRSTANRPGQDRLYSCVQGLEGFEVRLQEHDTAYFLHIFSIDSVAAPVAMRDLLNETLREKAGIGGFVATDLRAANPALNAKFDAVTILKKEGSRASFTITKSRGVQAYSIVFVARKAIAPVAVPVAAQPAFTGMEPVREAPQFLKQIRALLEESENGFADIKAGAMKGPAQGSKVFRSKMRLDGFSLSIRESKDSVSLIAEPTNLKISNRNAETLFDADQRQSAGITGYTMTYKAADRAGAGKYESVTSFVKEGMDLRVYKNLLHQWYRIAITVRADN